MKLKITDVVYKEPEIKKCNSVGCEHYSSLHEGYCNLLNATSRTLYNCDGLKRYHKKHPDQKPKAEVKYPCLMINGKENLIVKFSEKSKGKVILDADECYRDNLVWNEFDMNYFKPIESCTIKAVEE